MPNPHSLAIALKKPRAAASEEAMNRFERDIGLKIPPEYRKFLSHQNGGLPVKRNFRYGDGPYRDSVLRYFLGVESRPFDLKVTLKIYDKRIPPDTFPVATDEFDNLVLISRRRGAMNQILFWDHETELDGVAPAFVAKNLAGFLKMLEEDEDYEVEIATVTFEGGGKARRILPSKTFSLDRNAAIELRDARIGERIQEFGETKTILSIVFSRERGIS